MAIVNTDEHLGDTLMTHTRPHFHLHSVAEHFFMDVER
jgi:hypothetical protein